MGVRRVVVMAVAVLGLAAAAACVPPPPPQDTVAPVLSLPAPITAPATSPSGAAVTFSATAVDAVDGPVAVACTPASGSTFAVGATTVNCSASDAAGNVATGSFGVTVSPFVPGAVAVAAGQNFSCALVDDGTVRCWGFNGSGRLGNGTATNSSVPISVTGLGSGGTGASRRGSRGERWSVNDRLQDA